MVSTTKTIIKQRGDTMVFQIHLFRRRLAQVCIGLFTLTICLTQLNAQPSAPKKTLHAFFDAITEFDYETMDALTTTDFQLLEMGKVWTVDSLIAFMEPRREVFLHRKNAFHILRTRRQGNVAWMTYKLRAHIETPDAPIDITWLESAVFLKHRGQWKIDLLHSEQIE
ncbi:MAG: DUF4440 domain-containing protein [Candidatus Marinimicrobia bacterium]|nr:DUF4440 domain-containing protein [Candidatus Neomarinimicrobiota bacterium]